VVSIVVRRTGEREVLSSTQGQRRAMSSGRSRPRYVWRGGSPEWWSYYARQGKTCSPTWRLHLATGGRPPSPTTAASAARGGEAVRCGGDLPPNPRAALWLIGAVLVKQQDEREARRRYFGLASMAALYGAQEEQGIPVEAVEEVLTG